MQDFSELGHPNPLYMGIFTNRKIDSLGTEHQIICSFNKNNDIQAGIPHWKDQSRHAHLTPERYLLTKLRHLLKRGNRWGPQRLQYWNIQDLHFWIKILQWNTYKGLPINNRVFVTPPVALWPDACEYGILGYN